MENPLIDLGKLSEPLTKLVDVVGKGIGTIYAPWGTVRQANADAKARIITAKSETEVVGLSYRAKCRIEYQEAVRQYNIEQITIHAANALPEKVSNKAVDKDWIFQFFESAQNVCDEDMQILWGKILAGETNQPGSYSKRTIQFLKSLEKIEAEMFTKYCAFLFSFENGWPFVLFTDGARKLIIEKCDGNDPTLHFVNIGLLSGEFNHLPPSQLIGKKISYFNHKYLFAGSLKTSAIELGPQIYYVTTIGHQLSKIAGQKPCGGLVEAIASDLEKSENIKLKEVQNS
jgi:hypothetical protein